MDVKEDLVKIKMEIKEEPLENEIYFAENEIVVDIVKEEFDIRDLQTGIKTEENCNDTFKSEHIVKKKPDLFSNETEAYRRQGYKKRSHFLYKSTVSEKQVSILIDFAKEKTNISSHQQFWEDVSQLLNDEGPCVKTPRSWREWFRSSKAFGSNKKKIQKTLNECIFRYSTTVSKKQKNILIDFANEQKSTVPNTKFWQDVSKLLNNEGPCIKSAEDWSKWFGSSKLLPAEKELIQSVLQERVSEKVNDKQKQILVNYAKANINSSKKFQFWLNVSEILNAAGPCIQSPDKWKQWLPSSGIQLSERKLIRNASSDWIPKIVSENQKKILFDFAKQNDDIVKANEFWEKVSKLLNSEGPCIKSADVWRRWFEASGFRRSFKDMAYELRSKKTEAGPSATTPYIPLNFQTNLLWNPSVNEKQIQILLTFVEKKTLNADAEAWIKISEKLNKNGERKATADTWQKWFHYFRYITRTKLKRGDYLTELEKKVAECSIRIPQPKMNNNVQHSVEESDYYETESDTSQDESFSFTSGSSQSEDNDV